MTGDARMTDRIEPPASKNPPGWQGMSWENGRSGAASNSASSSGGGARTQDESLLTRFIGGSPIAVLMRLFILSLVVGALLIWLDIRPYEIFHILERFVQRIWLMGFDAIREITSYVLAGAVIVVPIWLILRLMNMRGK